ncbi:MAG TPA: aminoglycoside phosphotransferase [Pseudonocardiaceae bacterium]|jgi:maltokinase|nr:aminoglycoside phosphotransferase [Pseudonocardiaceae bacterium]
MSTAGASEILTEVTGSLAEWLPTQRWFAGKGRAVHAVRPVHAEWLISGDPGLIHAVVAVSSVGPDEVYQLLLGLRAELPEHLGSALLGVIDGRACYDATQDFILGARLLEKFGEPTTGTVVFDREPDVELQTGLNARLVNAEQSNSSLIFGHEYILKLFRRLTPGRNRDLDLHTALRSVGCVHIAEPLGSVHGELDGEPTIFGLLQRFMPDAAEGWAMATASVRDLMAEADLHAEEVGGDFAGEAHRLGNAVAAVHADLGTALGIRTAGPEALAAIADRMHRKLDETVRTVPELQPYVPALRAAFDEARGSTDTVDLQHVHGDLHLGQTLRTTATWLLIDFEGEPAATPAERVQLAPTLRDVAGMLRSFDYAAHQMLLGQPNERQLEVRAAEWARRNRDAFCTGYAELAKDPREQAALLRAFELEKAVYEVAYEHDNRPDWLPIPLAAIATLTEER